MAVCHNHPPRPLPKKWAKTPTEKLRHLLDYYRHQELGARAVAGRSTGERRAYAEGEAWAFSDARHHVRTMLVQLGQGS